LSEQHSQNNKVVLLFPKLEKPRPNRLHYLPLSLLALGTVAAREGYEVTIIDSRIDEDYEKRIRELDEEPLCFGISCIVGYQVKEALDIARLLKKRFPDTPIVWGGWFPTMLPDLTVRNPCADIVVRGQGENIFLELLESLSQSKDLSGINGITFMKNGQVVNTPVRPLEDPSMFPPLNYEMVDLSRYNSIQSGSINYQTSRGCPYRCKFCCTPKLYGRKWTGLKPKRVLDDLENLVSKYQINHIDFVDDNFLHSRERASRILEGIIERNLGISYTASVRINKLVKFDAAMFDLIKRSGCKMLYASSESGTDKILRVIQKDITVEQIRKMAELFDIHKIPAKTTFMVGLPKETREDLKATFLLSKELFERDKDLVVYYSFFLPIPGTDFFEDAKSKGLIAEPDTLEGWAMFAPVDQRQFWLFLTTSDNVSTQKRFEARKMAFFFWFGHYPRFARFIARSRLFFPLTILRRICAFRFDHDFYLFPIEWWAFRLIWNIKLFLFESR